MKCLFIAAAAACLTFASPAVAETDEELVERVFGEMKAFCTDKWGANYSMIEFCYDRQIKAASELDAAVKFVQSSEDTTLVMVLGHCIEKWEVPTGGHNYPMVQFCWETQFESYKRMNQQ